VTNYLSNLKVSLCSCGAWMITYLFQALLLVILAWNLEMQRITAWTMEY